MATEHSTTDCILIPYVPRNETSKKSRTTVEEELVAASRKTSFLLSSEYEFSTSIGHAQSIPPTGDEVINPSANTNKIAMCSIVECSSRITVGRPSGQIAVECNSQITIENNKCMTVTDEPREAASDELDKPHFYYPVQNSINLPEQQTTGLREDYRTYKKFVKKTRNSINYKIAFQSVLLALSISALYLGTKYIDECTLNFERGLILLVGASGVLSCLFRIISIAIARFRTNLEFIFYSLAVFFRVVFTLMVIAEIVAVNVAEKLVPCEFFKFYFAYMNPGIFLLAIILLFLYLDVIFDFFDS